MSDTATTEPAILTRWDAIDFLVSRGFRASEACSFVDTIITFRKTKSRPNGEAAAPAPKPRKVATTWPDGFALDVRRTAFAKERGFAEHEINRMWERFRDRNQARGEQYANWDAAWRTWVNNQVEFKNRDRQQHAARDHIDGRL